MHYLLHLNESEDDVSEEKDVKNDSSVEIRDVNTSSIDNKLNVKDNAAKMLDNRLQGTFVSKNVVNLSRRSLADSEISCCQKDVILFRLQTELETLGRILRLKWHFRNEENEFDLDQFKPKSSFNPRNKDAAIEIYMSSLEEKLMKLEIPKDKYNNPTSKERQALYDLKNDKILLLKVLVRGRH